MKQKLKLRVGGTYQTNEGRIAVITDSERLLNTKSFDFYGYIVGYKFVRKWSNIGMNMHCSKSGAYYKKYHDLKEEVTLRLAKRKPVRAKRKRLQ